jgi:hypothetical protein
MRWMIVVVMSLSVAAGACKEDEPFVADMKMICKAGEQSRGMDPEMQRVHAFKYIAEHIKTPEAARLIAEVARAAPSDHAALLAPAMQKAKLTRCPLFGL